MKKGSRHTAHFLRKFTSTISMHNDAMPYPQGLNETPKPSSWIINWKQAIRPDLVWPHRSIIPSKKIQSQGCTKKCGPWIYCTLNGGFTNKAYWTSLCSVFCVLGDISHILSTLLRVLQEMLHKSSGPTV